ncbi:NAD-dependent epimerase/dehydratase [Paenibacillus vortex V453]|uniref:NAD-dependent epimerase/dehydratase n=1 Tax=Paenibacillus vortex V453 TaxID=715225 RepID=A0A2R9SS80_9BACL|nr:NAD-dependent epimerase/dehydratase [Paenibacillus vortex V453]
MKVLVVGANGQIGKHLTHLLQDHEAYTVKAMVRKEEQARYFENGGIETVLANLEGAVDELAQAAQDCQAIVFAAGSGGATGYDKTLLIDLDGAAKMIEAAEQAHVSRFIMVAPYRPTTGSPGMKKSSPIMQPSIMRISSCAAAASPIRLFVQEDF